MARRIIFLWTLRPGMSPCTRILGPEGSIRPARVFFCVTVSSCRRLLQAAALTSRSVDGDGISDYFWLDPTGKGYGYLNTGHGTNNWQPIGQITSGDHPRELVRMGRMTTSGRADYIVLDPLTGAAQWYLNTGKDGNWQYSAQGVLATGPWKTIQDQFEWQFRVENVRFAE